MCAAICQLRMRQYDHAREYIEPLLAVEHAQTEALLIKCWSLTAALLLDMNSLNKSNVH
jgi:hypothetical protein